MQNLWPIVASVLGVFLIIGIGGICRRLQWLTPESDRSLASLAANVMLPAYFIHHILSSEKFASISSAWGPPAFGFLATALGFGISFLAARVLGRFIGLDTDSKQRAFALCVGVCNYGYIPLPLAEQFYQSALVDLILHNVGVDLALWSVGIAIISGTTGGGWKRAILSAPFLAVLFAISIRQLGWDQFIPAPILNAVGTLGNCAIPLGLLLSGAMIMEFLSESNWKGSAKMVFAAITIRQGIMPVLMLLATAAAANTIELRQVMMLQAAMPVAIFPIVLVRLYQRDTETALRVILSTSLAGVVLIPIWLAVGKWWLGV
ncbi:MAG: AEC family transporter [Rubripirellula sp.]